MAMQSAATASTTARRTMRRPSQKPGSRGVLRIVATVANASTV
jgi:hypothetical protein